jgi:hypothetical protein
VCGIGSSPPTGSAWWPVEETGQAGAGAMVLQLAAEQHSHGENAWSHSHALNTVLAMDMHDNHRCGRHTRGVPCHHVQFAVLAGRGGGSLDSVACHLVAAQSLFPQRCPRGSFLPILVLHREQKCDDLSQGQRLEDYPAVGSPGLRLDQHHDTLPSPFRLSGGGSSDVGEVWQMASAFANSVVCMAVGER